MLYTCLMFFLCTFIGQCSTYEPGCWVEESTYDEIGRIIGLHPIIMYIHVPVKGRSGVYMRRATGGVHDVGNPHTVQQRFVPSSNSACEYKTFL